MTDPPELPEDGNQPLAEDLSRSYESLLDQPAWEVDAQEPSATAPPPAEVAEPAAPPPVLRIVEALLFVGGPPLTAERAAEVIRGLTAEQFLDAIQALNRAYRQQGRPYHIQARDQGQVLVLRSRYRQVVDRLYGTNREARLSQAAIDVLALVAYRQPVSRQEIDGLRGADSAALLRQLVRRGLVAVVHRAEAADREVAYGTTARFLKLFGLHGLDDLPQTQDLQRL